MTKVFIGMPAYNGERFIREAIESVIGQSYADWVMLISDDASTDKTRAICEEYTKKDSRITYYRQEKNIGMFPNFKFLLDHADNEYFMWAAQDDMREPDYLGVCVKHLNENKDLGVTTTCTTLIDSKGEPVLNELELARLSGKPSFTSVAQYILQPEILGKCNLMYGVWRTEATRATWKAYPQRTTWGQDYMFSLALIARFPIFVDGRTLFKKRFGGFSNPGGLEGAQIEEFRKAKLRNPKNGMFPFVRFKGYFNGHVEALRGTPYLLGATLLLIRLPRAFVIYVKRKNFRKIFRLKN